MMKRAFIVVFPLNDKLPSFDVNQGRQVFLKAMQEAIQKDEISRTMIDTDDMKCSFVILNEGDDTGGGAEPVTGRRTGLAHRTAPKGKRGRG